MHVNLQQNRTIIHVLKAGQINKTVGHHPNYYHFIALQL